jgi:hypothetical protein
VSNALELRKYKRSNYRLCHYLDDVLATPLLEIKKIDLLIHQTRMCLCNKYYNEVYKNLSILKNKNVFFNVESDKEYQEWLLTKE